MTANWNFLTFIPDSGDLGTKVVTLANTPEAAPVDITPERPVFASRQADGTLINTTVEWNKKTIEMSAVFYDVLFDLYIHDLFESAVGFTLKVWYIDANFAEQTRYNAPTVFSTGPRTNFDMPGNKFNVSAVFREV